MGDVEGVEVCGELERGGHQADKAGQEQQVDELNMTTTTAKIPSEMEVAPRYNR